MPQQSHGDLNWFEETLPDGHRSGYVSVIGRPNVGKSSLMNAFLGQKLAIVSPKPQTTRNRLLGILTLPEAQIIFVDTPGIHLPQNKLGRYMVEMAAGAIPDADLVLHIVDLSVAPGAGERHIAQMLGKQTGGPVWLVLNKVDLVKPSDLQKNMDSYLALGRYAGWSIVSAKRGDNLAGLRQEIIAHLPEGPRFYPPDQITDQQERFLVGELIREQILIQTREEVPHGVAVLIEEYTERRPDLTYISATIYVERDTHKGILIGKAGERLKNIGLQARKDIEALVSRQVYLELWIKVRKKWRQDDRDLRELGYAAN